MIQNINEKPIVESIGSEDHVFVEVDGKLRRIKKDKIWGYTPADPSKVDANTQAISELNDNIEKIGEVHTSLGANFNFDNLTTAGIYYVGVNDIKTATNAPATDSGYLFVVKVIEGRTEVTAVAYSATVNRRFFRTASDKGVWSEWQELALKSDIVYTDVTLSGDPVASKGDRGFSCAIPNGYTPISVTDISGNNSLAANGILSSVSIYNGQAHTRYYNLAPANYNINGKVVRFWFRRI